MKKWVLGKWNSFLVCNYWGSHYFTQVSIMHLFLSHYIYEKFNPGPQVVLHVLGKRLEMGRNGFLGNGIRGHP